MGSIDCHLGMIKLFYNQSRITNNEKGKRPNNNQLKKNKIISIQELEMRSKQTINNRFQGILTLKLSQKHNLKIDTRVRRAMTKCEMCIDKQLKN